MLSKTRLMSAKEPLINAKPLKTMGGFLLISQLTSARLCSWRRPFQVTRCLLIWIPLRERLSPRLRNFWSSQHPNLRHQRPSFQVESMPSSGSTAPERNALEELWEEGSTVKAKSCIIFKITALLLKGLHFAKSLSQSMKKARALLVSLTDG